MNPKKASFWFVLTGLASVVILALTWLLAISPTLVATAAAQTQAEQQRSSNDVLQLQLTKLADQFTHLDEYKANLASMRLQVPSSSNLSELNRELKSIADSTGVTLSTITASPPTAFIPLATAPVAVVAAPAADSGSTADTTAAATPAAPAGTKGMYSVALSITASGTYDQTTAFLSSFQTGSQRLFLAETVNAVATTSAAGASGGLPPMAVGDITLTLTGTAYVLTDPAAAAVAPPVTPATPPVLPEPSGQKNPFFTVG